MLVHITSLVTGTFRVAKWTFRAFRAHSSQLVHVCWKFEISLIGIELQNSIAVGCKCLSCVYTLYFCMAKVWGVKNVWNCKYLQPCSRSCITWFTFCWYSYWCCGWGTGGLHCRTFFKQWSPLQLVLGLFIDWLRWPSSLWCNLFSSLVCFASSALTFLPDLWISLPVKFACVAGIISFIQCYIKFVPPALW